MMSPPMCSSLRSAAASRTEAVPRCRVIGTSPSLVTPPRVFGCRRISTPSRRATTTAAATPSSLWGTAATVAGSGRGLDAASAAAPQVASEEGVSAALHDLLQVSLAGLYLDARCPDAC